MLYHIQYVYYIMWIQTAAHKALPSLGFSRQEYWSGVPFPSPGDLPNPGMEPKSPLSPAVQVDSLQSEPPGKPGMQYNFMQYMLSGEGSGTPLQ